MKAELEKREITESIWSAVRNSIFPGATDESCLMALDYCKARGLDIMKKPCHIVPMNVKDAKKDKYEWRDVIMPGITETRITANRTGLYAGQDAPVFGPTVTLDFNGKKHEVPEFCTVTVYRVAGEERVPYAHTEYFEEAAGTNKAGDLNAMWTKRKRGQLAKCAEAGALRKAFPEETGGQTTYEEAIDVEAYEVEKPSQRQLVHKQAVNPMEGWKAKEATKGEATKDQTPKAPPPAKEQAVKQPDGMRGVLSDVTIKTGQKNDGSPWTAWLADFFVEGEQMSAGTYSQSLGEKAKSMIGQDVVFKVEYKNGHNTLKSINAEQQGDLV